MHVQASHTQVLVSHNTLGNIQNGLDVQTELDSLDRGIGFYVRLGWQIWIDSQGDVGNNTESLCHAADRMQFFFAFHVKEINVVL